MDKLLLEISTEILEVSLLQDKIILRLTQFEVYKKFIEVVQYLKTRYKIFIKEHFPAFLKILSDCFAYTPTRFLRHYSLNTYLLNEEGQP